MLPPVMATLRSQLNECNGMQWPGPRSFPNDPFSSPFPPMAVVFLASDDIAGVELFVDSAFAQFGPTRTDPSKRLDLSDGREFGVSNVRMG